jgi:hypothetical protein
MRRFSRFAVALASVLPFFGFFVTDSASAWSLTDIFRPASPNASDLNVRQGARSGVSGRNGYLDDYGYKFSDQFFQASNTGEKGASNFIIGVGKDAKNLFIAIAVIYLAISVLRLLFSAGGDDDVKKWKSSILWTTIGIMVMQSAYVFVATLYNKDVT